MDNTPTHYYSGVELKTATCDHVDVAEIGFVGRGRCSMLSMQTGIWCVTEPPGIDA